MLPLPLNLYLGSMQDFALPAHKQYGTVILSCLDNIPVTVVK